MIGFRPQQSNRHPIYGEQAARKVGYVEYDAKGTWFTDVSGKRLARITRYKPHQAPQAQVCLTGGSYVAPREGI